MKLGDLVLYNDQPWIVSRYDPKRTRTAVLLASSGVQEEVAHDLDVSGGVQVLANPGNNWPFITVPAKVGYSVAALTYQGRTLAHVSEWVTSDPLRSGGPVFLNPSIGLRYGDLFLVSYRGVRDPRKVVSVRVNVPRDFGTVRQRQTRAEAARPKPEDRNAFTRLLSEDPFGDG
jgi:hypothetical protein